MIAKRSIQIYSITLCLLIVAVLSIQAKWFVNAALHEEELIHDRMNTALCKAFRTIIKEESLEMGLNKCANLGNGKFEFLTNSDINNLDAIIKRQLIRIDEVKVPFKVTLASVTSTSSTSLSSDRTWLDGNNNRDQRAFVNLDMPTKSDLLIDQIDTDIVLSFVFMILIGSIFINVFKSLNNVQTVQYYTTNHIMARTVFHIGRYTFDVKNQKLTIDQKIRRITEKESQILRFLCDNKSQIVRRDEILTELWGENDYFKGRSLDVFVARLRKYLSKDRSIRIESVYGVGFILHDE